jgi:hypothetical protein
VAARLNTKVLRNEKRHRAYLKICVIAHIFRYVLCRFRQKDVAVRFGSASLARRDARIICGKQKGDVWAHRLLPCSWGLHLLVGGENMKKKLGGEVWVPRSSMSINILVSCEESVSGLYGLCSERRKEC